MRENHADPGGKISLKLFHVLKHSFSLSLSLSLSLFSKILAFRKISAINFSDF